MRLSSWIATGISVTVPEKLKKRFKPRLRINDTKKRLMDEIQDMQGFCWVTEGREIENYVPNSVLQKVVHSGTVSVGMYEKVPEHPSLNAFSGDKIDLANAVADQLTVGDLDHLDLWPKLEELVRRIKSWNQL